MTLNDLERHNDLFCVITLDELAYKTKYIKLVEAKPVLTLFATKT